VVPEITERTDRQTHSSQYSVPLFGGGVKGSPYSITERRVPDLIPVLGSQPAGDVSHKPAVGCHYFPPGLQLPPQPLRGCCQFCCLVNRGILGVNSLPKTVTRQRHDCDLNPGCSAPESSTLTTRLPSHPQTGRSNKFKSPVGVPVYSSQLAKTSNKQQLERANVSWSGNKIVEVRHWLSIMPHVVQMFVTIERGGRG